MSFIPIYAEEPSYQKIIALYVKEYGRKPTYICRAPGRVNLIGEHIDYCGYHVMPAALAQDMLIAVSPNGKQYIEVRNTDPQYQGEKIDLRPPEYHKEPEKKWLNYFLAAYKHILVEKKPPVIGFDALITSTVPISSGLSSSAAISVSSTLCSLVMHGLQDKYTREDMTPNIIAYERSVGLACGGMDQTISVFAENGKALLVEFNPIKTFPVALPSNAALVIANSLTPSEKISTAYKRYNLRVVECYLALTIMAIKEGKIKSCMDKKYKTFMDMQKDLAYSYNQMLGLVNKHLLKEDYTSQMLDKELGGNYKEVVEIVDMAHDMKEKIIANTPTYKLWKRATHVFGEAQRVQQFKDKCDGKADAKELGALMNQSHFSCKDLYECSSTQLDILTDLCRKAGAFGSRLTGAGWGGCCVSLIDASKANEFIAQIKKVFN
jgi:N-acetylgalactosamine kinase